MYQGKAILLLLVVVSTVSACASSDYGMTSMNQSYQENNLPIRMAPDPNHNVENSVRYIETWAGEAVEAPLNKHYQTLSLQELEKLCNYKAINFIETRLVEKDGPNMKIVWVFNDELSKREDGTSGIQINYEYTPETNRTEMYFFGKCHAGAGHSMVFSN